METPDFLERAGERIRECEQSLRGLLAEAVQAGDYSAVLALTSLAKELMSLGSASPASDSRDPESPPNRTPAENGRAQISRGKTERARRVRKSQASSYPRFERVGDELIKVGWSKKQKSEYRHKAPWHAVRALVQALVTAGREGRMVSSEDILPLPSPENGGELPAYQAYLALAWLVHEDLVIKHGRQGYTVPKPDNITQRIRDRWTALDDGRNQT